MTGFCPKYCAELDGLAVLVAERQIERNRLVQFLVNSHLFQQFGAHADALHGVGCQLGAGAWTRALERRRRCASQRCKFHAEFGRSTQPISPCALNHVQAPALQPQCLATRAQHHGSSYRLRSLSRLASACAHLMVRIALRDETAWALGVRNIGHKGRRIADAGGNSPAARAGKPCCKRQFHGAIHWDAHDAVVLDPPSRNYSEVFPAAAQYACRSARGSHLQIAARRQHARVFKRRSGLAQALHLAIKIRTATSWRRTRQPSRAMSHSAQLQQAARIRVAVFVAFVWRAERGRARARV